MTSQRAVSTLIPAAALIITLLDWAAGVLILLKRLPEADCLRAFPNAARGDSKRAARAQAHLTRMDPVMVSPEV